MLVLSALAVGKTFPPALLGTESWQGEPGSAFLPRRAGGIQGRHEGAGREGAAPRQAELRAVPCQTQTGQC